jgi:hypothetical protein
MGGRPTSEGGVTQGLPLFDWRPPPLVIATRAPTAPLFTLNRDNRFDLKLNVANLREYKFGRLATTGKIELKSETWQWRQTGNIGLEYAQFGRPSGMAVSEAEAWVHELNDDEGKLLASLMFPLQRVKEFGRYCVRRDPRCIKHGCGDSGTVDLVAAPLRFFADWLLKGGGS